MVSYTNLNFLFPSWGGCVTTLFSISKLDSLDVIPLIKFDISSYFSSDLDCLEEEGNFSSFIFFLSFPPLFSSSFNLLEANKFDSTSIVSSCIVKRLACLVALNHNENLLSKAFSYVIIAVVYGGFTSTRIFW